MEIIFYGAGKWGREALERYKRRGSARGTLKGFADSKKTGDYCGYPIIPIAEADGQKVCVVITIQQPMIAGMVYNQLKRAGMERIYWFLNREEKEGAQGDFLEEECRDLSDFGPCVLPKVEMHIADHCNLNCKGCTHFSPVFEKELPDFEERMHDVALLKEKMPHIMLFSILGGEPFLNPEIGRYAAAIRALLPDTQIQIVTNGLLIPQLDGEILNTIREQGVVIQISEYRPTYRIRGRIQEKLDEYGVMYQIQPYEAKQKFIRPLSLSAHSRHPHACISDQCVNIWNGKIARCPTLMYIDRFNAAFDKSLPNEGILSLEDCPKGTELLALLERDVPLCRHCVRFETEWESCGGRPDVADFAGDD